MMRKNLAKTVTRALALVLTIGTVGAVWQPHRVEAQDDSAVPMYRLYNPNSGEHFYTGNVGERDNLDRIGWNYEGIGWYAPASSSLPVYRLYNPNAGDHHYTLNAGERDMLVGVGWNYEGVGWYSDEAQRAPLYRQYNPNAVAGAHNFTTNKYENDYLASIGWNAEGIGWYGIREGSPADRSGRVMTIDEDPAYASIEADVTLNTTNCKGSHAKLLMNCGGVLASFGVQYAHNTNQFSTRTAFLLENIYDKNTAAQAGGAGKNYVFISQANRDTTYRLRLSWEKSSNTLHCYVNDEELAIDTNLATTRMQHHPFIIGVEASGMANGDTIDATFSNIKIKLGDSSDNWYGTAGNYRVEKFFGLNADITKGVQGPSAPFQNTVASRGTYNWSAHLYGTVQGAGGSDWDTSLGTYGDPISSVVTLVQRSR